MKKLLIIFLILLPFTLSSQWINNGESGLSVRTKLNDHKVASDSLFQLLSDSLATYATLSDIDIFLDSNRIKVLINDTADILRAEFTLELSDSLASYFDSTETLQRISDSMATKASVSDTSLFNLTGNILTPKTVTNKLDVDTIIGSQVANGDLIIGSTSHATKTTSSLTLQPNGSNVGIGRENTASNLEIFGIAGTNPVINISDGDVNQPFTSIESSVNTFGTFRPLGSNTGGMLFRGFSSTGTASGIQFNSYIGNATPSVAALKFTAAKYNGFTGSSNIGDAEKAFEFSNISGSKIYMTILGNANTGINEAAPLTKLHVSDASASTSVGVGLTIINTNATTNNIASIYIGGDEADNTNNLAIDLVTLDHTGGSEDNVLKISPMLAGTQTNIMNVYGDIVDINGLLDLNFGTSVFIGTSAGANDDGTNNNNIGIGYETLMGNVGGFENTAIGHQVLKSNTAGKNTGIGYWSLSNNGTGLGNTAIGDQSLYTNISGDYNVAIGLDALYFNDTGNNNTAIGKDAGYNALGSGSIFIGYQSGQLETGSNKLYIDNSNTTTPLIYGDFANDSVKINGTLEVTDNLKITGLIDLDFGTSVFIGTSAGANDDGTSNQNIGIGFQSLTTNISGSQNIGIGYSSLLVNTGVNNTAVGWNSMLDNTSGHSNIALGHSALENNITGDENVAIGRGALTNNTAGNGNICIGYQAGFLETGSNKLYIDNSNSSTPLIYGDFDANSIIINGTLDVIGDLTVENDIIADSTITSMYVDGQLFTDDGSVTVTHSVTGTYYILTGLRDTLCTNMTVQDSIFIIQIAGRYDIEMYGNGITNNTNSTIVHFSAFKNSTEQIMVEGERKIGTAGDVGSAAIGGYFDCVVGDTLSVKSRADKISITTFGHFNFIVKRRH